jgi:hypothetical protein
MAETLGLPTTATSAAADRNVHPIDAFIRARLARKGCDLPLKPTGTL